jgi:phosphoribosylformylglycinamidine synthase
MKPRALILRTAGINCDRETAYAFELAGSEPHAMHVNHLLENPAVLHDFQLLAVPGGFSYGDDISAGKIFANQLMHHLSGPLHRFVEDGKPIIGICNGFQVLLKTDLLSGGAAHGQQSCTLTNNDCAHYVDRWVSLASVSRKCIWTAGLEPFELPVAHGEGKFIVVDDQVRRDLHEDDRIALVYALADGSPAGGQFPQNPNGSIDDIAGICDATGLVLGLMPHPERSISPFQHPAWTLLPREARSGEGAGMRLFQNAVRHVTGGVGAGV